MNSDDQLPDGQQYHSHQQDATHHCEQNHEGICPSAALWKEKSTVADKGNIHDTKFETNLQFENILRNKILKEKTNKLTF